MGSVIALGLSCASCGPSSPAKPGPPAVDPGEVATPTEQPTFPATGDAIAQDIERIAKQ